MSKRSFTLITLAAFVVVAGTALAAAPQNVLYHGVVVSSQTTIIGGRPYVPLSDMARVLGGRVVPHGAGYEIVTGGNGSPGQTTPGGANEVRGENGKVGDWFFNGYWRFRVESVEHTDEYHFRFVPYSGSAKPNGANDELVIITCQIKNGHKEAEEPILTANGLASQSTALTDDQGQSYAPMGFDVRGGNLVAGAAKTFAIEFSVPKGAHLQTLIFTMYGFGVTSNKASNVRVALGP